MIYATLDLEIMDDGPMLRLERARPEWPWWYMRLVVLAKRANEKGRLIQGRIPITADDLAMIHHRDPDRAQEWQGLLDHCVVLGLLILEDDVYSIADWRRWHRKPSDDPERVAERVALHRVSSRYTEDVTHVTPQSRAEHSTAEQNKSRAEKEQPQSKDRARARTPAEAAAVVSECFMPIRDRIGLAGGQQPQELEIAMTWAMGPLMDGRANDDDIRVAAEYARRATNYRVNEEGRKVKSRWRYANSIAAEHLDEIITRRKLREQHAELGLPEPAPYVFEVPTQDRSTT